MIIEIKRPEDVDALTLDAGVEQEDNIEKSVREIVENVRKKGDGSLFEYIKRFDNYDPEDGLLVTTDEIEAAKMLIPEKEKRIIQYARERIERFHRFDKPRSSFIEEEGALLGVRYTPVRSCGLYVPGGKAAYPSTALMTIVPAVVAGVKDISIATPPVDGAVNPYVLYAADLCGVTKIYKMGGAHAIAAFAYGTQSVGRVDVIAGPGNIYVALAKKIVYGDVGIDSIAGPSEIMVVADSTANARYIAYDLLSQAEHDERAGCFFVSTDIDLVSSVKDIFMRLAQSAARSRITSLSSRNARFFHVKNLYLAALLVDRIAPEHLELHLEKPYEFMNSINNAGAIFIGQWSPEPIGDYVAGANHTLPTGGTARFASVLSAEVFMKKSSIIHYSRNAFLRDAPYAAGFAQMEGLFAHRDAVEVRYRDSDR